MIFAIPKLCLVYRHIFHLFILGTFENGAPVVTLIDGFPRSCSFFKNIRYTEWQE